MNLYFLGVATPLVLALIVFVVLRYGPLLPYLFAYMYIFFSPTQRKHLAANHIWDRMQCGGVEFIDYKSR